MPTINFNQGQNTSEDEKRLAKGELVQSVGAEYRVGNKNDIFKIPGRGDFADTGSARRVTGLALLQFDTKSSDRLVALSNGTLYSAVPGTGAEFSSLKTGLSTSATNMSYAHFNDRHFISNGYDRMQVMDSALSIRGAGMIAPTAKVVGTGSVATGTVTRATVTVANSGFSDFADSIDTSVTTFASAARSSSGVSTATWGWATATPDPADQVIIVWGLSGDWPADSVVTRPIDPGDSGYDVTITFQVSEDDGATFTTVLSESHRTFTNGVQQLIVDRGSSDNDQLQVKASIAYISGVNQAVLQVFDVKAQEASAGATVTLSSTGLRYARTEYDANSGLESPPSPLSDAITGTLNQVTITGPTASSNTNTTHYRYYRTPDGGVAPQDLGFIGQSQIGSSKIFIDDFSIYSQTDQPSPPLEMISVAVDGGILYFIANKPPPLMDDIVFYDGAMVGIKGRSLYYSLGGRPESWPNINVITKFPFKKHDTLVGLAVVGDTLVMGAKQLIMLLDGLPRIDSGIVSSSEVRKLEGAPGLVSQYGITEYSDDDDSGGESRVAWVSRFGVHETNGFRHRRMTSDIDWTKNVTLSELDNAVLRWNAETQQMIFAYSPSRYALIHLADEHRKANGRPKITWGHYGKITDITSGFFDGKHIVYSGHTQNGKVFTERNGLSDSSQTFDKTGVVPFVIETGKIYSDGDYSFVTKANLSHSGSPDTQKNSSREILMSATWTSGRDNPEEEASNSFSVDLKSSGGTQFGVLQSGEWHQVKLEHLGFADFSLQDLRMTAESLSEAGDIA